MALNCGTQRLAPFIFNRKDARATPRFTTALATLAGRTLGRASKTAQMFSLWSLKWPGFQNTPHDLAHNRRRRRWEWPLLSHLVYSRLPTYVLLWHYVVGGAQGNGIVRVSILMLSGVLKSMPFGNGWWESSWLNVTFFLLVPSDQRVQDVLWSRRSRSEDKQGLVRIRNFSWQSVLVLIDPVSIH